MRYREQQPRFIPPMLLTLPRQLGQMRSWVVTRIVGVVAAKACKGAGYAEVIDVTEGGVAVGSCGVEAP